MAEPKPEVVARVIEWCAEAGRRVTEDEVRAALRPLSWDQLLAAQGILADPPPARPLGVQALADMARGASADVAADREREGRYRAERDEGPAPAAAPVPAPRARGTSRRRRSPLPQVRVRRARDREEVAGAAAPPLPLLDELFAEEGRAVIERLVRAHGARRARIVSALAAGWRRPDGAAVTGSDLDALLDVHGLARSFPRRERDLILHVLRAQGGVRPRAAAHLGLTVGELDAALARLEAAPAADAIREAARREIASRATLSERVYLLASDEERLADLGVLGDVLDDLRARLPEHVKALRASGKRPLAAALGRSLSLSRPAVEALATRFGLDLASPPAPAVRPRPAAAPPRRPGPRRRPPRRGHRGARRP